MNAQEKLSLAIRARRKHNLLDPVPAKVKEENYAEQQAKAQLENVRELVKAWEHAAKAGDSEDAEQRIYEDALSVECRSGWYQVGSLNTAAPEEYRIVLCTGGPHVEIRGTLGKYNEPETAGLFYQDRFTRLFELRISGEDQDTLLTYAGRFYFGEG